MYTVRIFRKCTHVCAAQTTHYFFTKSLIEHDFPCLADEIAERRPDMNIKVAAFTESEKSSYMYNRKNNIMMERQAKRQHDLLTILKLGAYNTLVNVYVDLLVFTRIAGTP